MKNGHEGVPFGMCPVCMVEHPIEGDVNGYPLKEQSLDGAHNAVTVAFHYHRGEPCNGVGWQPLYVSNGDSPDNEVADERPPVDWPGLHIPTE